MKDNFLILGGDQRALYLGEYLEKNGYIVNYQGFSDIGCYSSLKDAINNNKFIVLPLPLSKDGVTLNTPFLDETILLSDIISCLDSNKLVFGGKMAAGFCEKLKEKGTYYCDYLLLEELAVYNAIPTAEGVVEILINNTPSTLHSMKIAITGYGKVGKVIAEVLRNLGAEVTIFARKESDFAYAYLNSLNFENIENLGKAPHSFNALINTIPAKVIRKKELLMLNPDCLLIEIASAPFGIDFQGAKELAFNLVKAGSLPGKVAPKTAGEIIGRSILPIIKARGY